jgi:type I restriction enzyme S subunit
LVKDLEKSPSYKFYKDSNLQWLGVVPSHWKITRLGGLFKERRTKVSDKDFPPLSVTKNGILPQLENAAKTNDGDNRKLVRSGDFVINSRSDRKGSSGVSEMDGSVSLINIVLEPRGINRDFCQYLFKSYSFVEEFYRIGHGIVADLWTTRYDEMRSIVSAFPPLSEQANIANFLDCKGAQIDQAIQIKERQIERLKERKQILIQQAVTRGLDPHAPMRDSGIEWIGEIPAHWDIKKIRYLGTTQNGISAGAEFFGHGYPFVSYGDVYNNEQLPESVSGLANASASDRYQYSLECGDVLFTRTSETIEEIGFASTCFKGIANSTFAGFLIRFRPKTNALFEGFSKYYFNAPMLRDYFVKEMSIVTRASLSQQLLKNMPVLLPPVAEQKEIYAFLECESARFSNSINIQIQQIKNLKEYKSTLINSAVTGKIKVPGVVEPAEIQEREIA